MRGVIGVYGLPHLAYVPRNIKVSISSTSTQKTSSAERHCGDAVVLMLQEICSHAPEARPTLLQGKDRGPEVLRLTLHAAPVAAVKAHRGTLAGLGGAGSPPYIEVALQVRGCARRR